MSHYDKVAFNYTYMYTFMVNLQIAVLVFKSNFPLCLVIFVLGHVKNAVIYSTF